MKNNLLALWLAGLSLLFAWQAAGPVPVLGLAPWEQESLKPMVEAHETTIGGLEKRLATEVATSERAITKIAKMIPLILMQSQIWTLCFDEASDFLSLDRAAGISQTIAGDRYRRAMAQCDEGGRLFGEQLKADLLNPAMTYR